MKTHFPLYVLVVFHVLFSIGCAPNKQFYGAYDRVCVVDSNQACEGYAIQAFNQNTESEYLLGFAEIDDQGQLRDRAQLQAVVNNLNEIAAKDSLLITVFVHGWHHSAEPGDDNIENFKKSLVHLSKIEHTQRAKGKQRKVVGIYVGWRGESITVPGINLLTFWDRKNTAHDIGYLGITELLLKLEETTNVKNTMEPPIKSRLVVIGHSFGGAVVFSATAQILLDRFINSEPGKNDTEGAEGFGDLVVLLNPAFEALRFAPAFELAQSRCSYFPSQVPKLAILTSETDNATGIAFPLGRTLNTFFETHDELKRNNCGYVMTLDEGEADRNTVGHYEPLISHTLTQAENKPSQQVARVFNAKNIWAQQKPGESIRFGGTMLTHLKKTPPQSPYLNVKVDEALMDGHNDIYGDKIAEFIELLINLSTDDKFDEPKQGLNPLLPEKKN